jgi:diguanylate cyclase (GGDEF)-like protein
MQYLYLFGNLDLSSMNIPIPVALAIMATIGYLVGRRTRKSTSEMVEHSKRELRHAQTVASELEKISWGIRKSLAKHHSNVTRFKDRISRLSDQHDESAWKELCREAEEILKPTLKLATQIANAYDDIRQQSANLMTFTEVRTDPLTNVKNRRALDDAIQAQFALMSRYDTPFSIVMFDMDHFKPINDEHGHLHGDKMLQDLAHLLDEYVRETDVVTRYGGDEFVVVMPQTDLDGACMLSERLRAKVQEKMSVTISGGVSSAQKGDTQETLISRADAALYQAKTSGRNCIFRHDGENIAQVPEEEVLNVL